MAWRPLVLAILVYVTLDLSVAWMPGAFVFEAAETVESVRTDGIQEISDTTAPSEPAFSCDRLLPEGCVRRTVATTLSSPPVFWSQGSGERTASVESAPSPTDDPH